MKTALLILEILGIVWFFINIIDASIVVYKITRRTKFKKSHLLKNLINKQQYIVFIDKQNKLMYQDKNQQGEIVGVVNYHEKFPNLVIESLDPDPKTKEILFTCIFMEEQE